MRIPFRFQLIARLLVIIVLAGFAGCAIVKHALWFWSAGAVFLLVGEVVALIRSVNRVNERISYFFEAVKNDDFSLVFPNRKDDRILQKLNENMAAVNRQIQQIHSRNEQQEKYFHALIESVKIGILTFDERGFVVDVNHAFLKCTGLDQFTHLSQLKRLDRHLYEGIHQLSTQGSRLITFSGPSGKTSISVRSSVFRQKNQLLRLLTVQEINQELDEKELDSWMRLIRVLTHEIMNSIAPVTSLADTLSNFFSKDGRPVSVTEIDERTIASTIRGLEVIREQGRGLIHFVELYRKFTRLPKPEKEVVDLRKMIDRIILLNQAILKEQKIILDLQINDDATTATIDEKLVSQVLINLLKNGVEALRDTFAPRISIGVQNKSGRIAIVVQNNGPEIPAEIMDEIFVPFFTTRENGNGIGLSLSRQIMRLHGGSLKVVSDPIKTVFTLLFDR